MQINFCELAPLGFFTKTNSQKLILAKINELKVGKRMDNVRNTIKISLLLQATAVSAAQYGVTASYPQQSGFTATQPQYAQGVQMQQYGQTTVPQQYGQVAQTATPQQYGQVVQTAIPQQYGQSVQMQQYGQTAVPQQIQSSNQATMV